MSELNIKFEGSNAQIADMLRLQLAYYSGNPLRSLRWWSGFVVGAIVVAAMDFSDVWLCVGSCGP